MCSRDHFQKCTSILRYSQFQYDDDLGVGFVDFVQLYKSVTVGEGVQNGNLVVNVTKPPPFPENFGGEPLSGQLVGTLAHGGKLAPEIR